MTAQKKFPYAIKNFALKKFVNWCHWSLLSLSSSQFHQQLKTYLLRLSPPWTDTSFGTGLIYTSSHSIYHSSPAGRPTFILYMMSTVYRNKQWRIWGPLGHGPPLWPNFFFDIGKKLENLVWPPFVRALVASENLSPFSKS